MNKTNIGIMFGGMSPEHEVSIISGLQILRNINRDLYNPIPIFINKSGNLYFIEKYKSEKDFLTSNRREIAIINENDKGYLMYTKFPFKKIQLDCVYTTLHGGTGELGIIQGLLESMNIPQTSPNVESSLLCMNKQISKDIVEKYNVPTVKGISILSSDIKREIKSSIERIKKSIKLPVILKPVHLGSSIGIHICKTEIELKLGLLSSSLIDDEILLEQFLPDITEYNISVFYNNKNQKYEFSPIEKPLKQEQILTFKDKYENGAKGKLKVGGMASLDREIPAKINSSLQNQIIQYSQEIYKALKCKGQVRIDFISSKKQLYFSEINPIPGSLAFYLWEARGESFKDQITRVVEDCLNTKSGINNRLEYKTDIVEKYIKAMDR